MTTKNSQKIIPKFSCNHCDYICSKKSDYDKHLATLKHSMTTRGLHDTSPEHTAYVCECNKAYSCRQNLYRHKRTCSISAKDPAPPNPTPTDIMQLIQQNHEFKELLIEQNKQMMELISEINLEYSDDGILSKATKYAIKQALKEVNNEK